MHTPSIEKLFDSSNKSVLVTGSSAGIGASITYRFSEAGANVGIYFNRQEIGRLEIVRRIEQLGRITFTFRVDISQTSESSICLRNS